MGPLPSNKTYTVVGFEAEVTPNKLRHQGSLHRITIHHGVDTTAMWVSLSWEDKRAHVSIHDLEA